VRDAARQYAIELGKKNGFDIVISLGGNDFIDLYLEQQLRRFADRETGHAKQ
jgi:hypothetical protein